jgi:alpha-amylase
MALAGCAASRPAPRPAPDAAIAAPGAAAPAAAPQAVAPHAEWAEAVLYHVLIDRFADGDPANNRGVDLAAKGAFHGGDLAGLRAQLDEISGLGATALWVSPVVDNIDGFVTGAGFPDWAYHGYWADDFERPDRRFGTDQELRALVAAAHERGMKVLLDVVYNHVGYGSAYLERPAARGWLRTPAAGTCGDDDLTSCLSGLPDLRTEDPAVAAHLLAAHLGRAARAGVDGFRLDAVKHVGHDFWRRHRERVRAELGAEFFLLGEVWGGDAAVLEPWFASDELDAGFDFGFGGNVIAFLAGRGRPVAFNAYLERHRRPRAGHLLAHYLSSHDVPGALHQLGGDRELFRLAAVLQMTASGIPVVYYGEEVGRPGGEWPDNRSDMPWGARGVRPGAGRPRDEGLREDYRRLIAIRRAHPALWRGEHRGLQFETDLLVFLRTDPATGDAVAVAVNRGAAPGAAAFDAPPAWRGRPLRDELSGAELSAAAGERVEFEVAPRGARIVAAAAPEEH